MDDDQAALSRCIGDIERFADEIWGRRPDVVRDRGPFSDLLSMEDVEQMLGAAARRPSFRLVRDGVTLPASSYTRSVRIGGTVVDDAADLDRITALAAAGATIVLQGLHVLWPPLQRFCARLERAASHRVQANAYLSPAGSAGLGHHTDTHEVLALQVEGEKGWEVDGLGLVTLVAGDVLYLPAGTGHAAAAQAQHSLHITIGILATSGGQLVQRVLAGGDEHRRPLPLGYARPGHEGELQDVLAGALKSGAERLLASDPGAIAATAMSMATGRSRPDRSGALRAVLDPSAIGDQTLLRRDPARALQVREDGDDAVLEGNGRRLRAPAGIRAAFDLVLVRPELRVGDLPGLDGPERAVLARRLVRDGFLEVANPTALAKGPVADDPHLAPAPRPTGPSPGS